MLYDGIYAIMSAGRRHMEMARTMTRSNQSFEYLVSNNFFYVDKTMFIKEWWKKGESVTLITRPRRFGKTLTLNMVERFFSVQYEGKPEVFANLDIFKDSEMMKEQGKYPVISLSMAGATEPTYEGMISSLSRIIRKLFGHVKYDLGYDKMQPDDIEYIEMMFKKRYGSSGNILPLDEGMIKESILLLSDILERAYDNKVLILLDEYDAPLENAYLKGYWDKAAEFFGQFYKNTFKLNEHLGRALIIGVNMIPKESLSSPFNNPATCSVTDPFYGDSFGFTQEEVDDALDEYGLLELRDEVKRWYDGYQFGRTKGMYNPLSICSVLDSGEFEAYWWGSASNKIVGHVIKNGSMGLKDKFVPLLQGKSVKVTASKEVTYDVLLDTEDSVWGLLLSCGYLKPLERNGSEYVLSIVNHEVMVMMDTLVMSWFKNKYNSTSYDAFNQALVECNEAGMQENLSSLSLELMGSFDTANEENSKEAENFYHGFVLGLVASLRERYDVTSNRESGKGRYDIMLEPLDRERDNGIIIEFKISNPKKEENLEGTCPRALQQIEDKKYDVELKKHGIPEERIAKFGIGYTGKDVLVRKKGHVKEEGQGAKKPTA